MQILSPIILRIGIGAVIVWFGLQQINTPSSWIVYLPTWTKILPLSQINFVYLNGWFELIFGIILITGFFTRIVAFFLSIHLLGIVLTVGYNEIGVRDFGLFIALFSIFLHGENNQSRDKFT